MVYGRRLVGVELFDAARAEHLPKAVVNRRGECGVFRGTGRYAADGCDPAVRTVRAIGQAASQAIDDGLQRLIVSRIRPSCRQHDREMVTKKERKRRSFLAISSGYCALNVSPISRLPVSGVQPPFGIALPHVTSIPASAPKSRPSRSG